MAPPFQRWLARTAEKMARRYYEGPEPPARLARSVDDFAALYPRAARGAWIALAKQLAEDAYREGYTRGIENYERDLDAREPFSPDELIEMEPSAPPEMPSAADPNTVPDEGSSLGLEDQAAYLELKGQYEREHLMGRGPRRS
jgi:hypothetical protein